MRLIDLDELLKFPIRLDKYDKKNGNEHFVFGIETVLEYAENLPTVDAVDRELYEQCKFDKDIAEEQLRKLVRCKDCKYSSPNGKYGCNLITDDGSREMGLLGDDYCSYGEREDDGSNILQSDK